MAALTGSKNEGHPLWKDCTYLRMLVEQLPVVIWMTDLDLRITASIGGGLTILGLKQNEAVGASLYQMFADQELDSSPVQAHQQALEGKSSTYEITLGTRLYQVAVEPLRDETDTIAGCLAIASDITAHKEAEELRRVLAKEVELSELKTRFAAMVSHEFRTPLAVIQSSYELIRHYGNRMDDERKLQHLDTISSQVQHLTRLLEDIAIVISDGLGHHFDPGQIDLVALCREVIAQAQVCAPTHHLSFTIMSNPGEVMADAKLVRHALTNLISNAIKYSPIGSTVSVSLSFEDSRITISVQDEGIGISEFDQPRLFEMFHRGNNVQGIAGTGLGLAIVKNVVEAHGGTVTFETQLGRGSTFKFTLPVATQSA